MNSSSETAVNSANSPAALAAGGEVLVNAGITERNVTVQCAFPAGLITAIVGPNGAGKSTILGMISGLLTPDSGEVRSGETVFADATRSLPPHQRPVAMLTQKPLLFPHLSVLENVAFGPRARHLSRSESRRIARQELAAVGALELADRPATALSGGQSQRVALARALATHPQVVLLDEPFSALDVETSAKMREVLSKRLRQEPRPTVIFVTHDPLDVWMLADHVVAIENGHLIGEGTVVEMLGQPATKFLENLSGMNLLAGIIEESDEVATVNASGVELIGLWQGNSHPGPQTPALTAFAPQSVALFDTPVSGSPRNTWQARVTDITPRGAVQWISLNLAGGQSIQAVLTPQAVNALHLAPGSPIYAEVKATQITVYPR
ncbi:sulfate/molybdate ABC transporter ATP-binding protein [Mobiluncus curtisii]|uniref:ABC transporter, ATP-binding protein n=2 Tax=Mobiluncus curtisii TaxID=2051 RepID=D6ZGL9_MOBCV|nr:ABC transporter ATP-binding protein [Mobiluncus curtisii]ADI67777.1 ABC transporter, ATP-binding protein [Mobiluncus curtisii ATCC 43063]QQU08528.1 ABC transporter ATP-binding protein [Mobiluncus curtisii]SQB64783.1 Spermidine/putrescine import ATP-binding protein PotA [Mobiluncus curtisii]